MLAAPPKATRTRKQSLEQAEKLDMNEISEKVKAIEALTPTNNSSGHRFSTISIGNLNIDSMLSPTNQGRRGSNIPFRSPSIHENNANINPFFSSPPPPSGQKAQIMKGKLFFYLGSKPIRSEDWRPAYVSLNGSKFTGVMTNVDENSNPLTPTNQSARDFELFNWNICVTCKVGKAEDISKKGDRSKWGYVFSVECDFDGDRKELYFVAETDNLGASWVQAVYDARYSGNDVEVIQHGVEKASLLD